MKKKLIILAVILVLILSLFVLWWKQASKPVNPQSDEIVEFTVEKGETVRNIAGRLNKAGIIRSPVAFFLIARFGGVAEKIQAGDFRFQPAMQLREVADTLLHGTEDVWLTVVEGWRSEEIATKLAKEFFIPESSFLENAKEGYMFPDTYLLPKEVTGEGMVGIFLENFDLKVNDEIRQKALSKGLSLDDLVNIAAMVEREALLDEDRPIIASVILNRLSIGMKLDIDATVQYAIGYQVDEKSWWKRNLTLEDLQADSPFNTYINNGLPPGPIANPGFAAIKSVVEAPDTDYLYYIADSEGKSHFASSFEGHNENISNYLNR